MIVSITVIRRRLKGAWLRFRPCPCPFLKRKVECLAVYIEVREAVNVSVITFVEQLALSGTRRLHEYKRGEGLPYD